MEAKFKEEGITVRVGNTTITTQRTFGNASLVDLFSTYVAKNIQEKKAS